MSGVLFGRLGPGSRTGRLPNRGPLAWIPFGPLPLSSVTTRLGTKGARPEKETYIFSLRLLAREISIPIPPINHTQSGAQKGNCIP